ncbi:MAG: dephospho-CoA kinase [Aestuariivirgaceae bacterium]
MKIIGLTGSIAMGKTHTARIFAEEGIPVFDADAVVHGFYQPGGKAVDIVRSLSPGAIVEGGVDRRRLSAAIMQDEELLRRLEQAIHPLVREEQEQFLERQRRKNAPLVVIDVPLLFETGREKEFDSIIVVSAPPEIQRQRALARPGMTPEKLDLMLSRQTPDHEKRARADFVVETGGSKELARSQVKRIVNLLSASC